MKILLLPKQVRQNWIYRVYLLCPRIPGVPRKLSQHVLGLGTFPACFLMKARFNLAVLISNFLKLFKIWPICENVQLFISQINAPDKKKANSKCLNLDFLWTLSNCNTSNMSRLEESANGWVSQTLNFET